MHQPFACGAVKETILVRPRQRASCAETGRVREGGETHDEYVTIIALLSQVTFSFCPRRGRERESVCVCVGVCACVCVCASRVSQLTLDKLCE
jgi:hypothetical protein